MGRAAHYTTPAQGQGRGQPPRGRPLLFPGTRRARLPPSAYNAPPPTPLGGDLGPRKLRNQHALLLQLLAFPVLRGQPPPADESPVLGIPGPEGGMAAASSPRKTHPPSPLFRGASISVPTVPWVPPKVLLMLCAWSPFPPLP